MKQMEMAQAISNLTAEQQKEFFNELSGKLTEKEIEAIQIVSAYIGWLSDPRKEKAIKTAMAQELYNEFNK